MKGKGCLEVSSLWMKATVWKTTETTLERELEDRKQWRRTIKKTIGSKIMRGVIEDNEMKGGIMT